MNKIENTVNNDCWEKSTLTGHLDSQGVLAVVRASLPGSAATHKTENYWRWKHIENPFGESVGTLAKAESTGEVVAVRSFMQWRFSTGTSNLIAVRAVDTATAKMWRGKGIFKKLTMEAIKDLEVAGVDLIFNTPNQNSAPGYIKMGWNYVDSVPLYIHPLKPLEMFWSLIKYKFGENGSTPAKRESNNKLPRWTELEKMDEILDIVNSSEVNRARASFALRTVRLPDYLLWRYGRNPQVDYRVYVFHKNNRIEAVAVIRLNIRYGLHELILAEIWARDARVDLMVQLLNSLFKDVDADYVVAHFSENSVEYIALRKSFFFRVPIKKMQLFVRKLSKPLPDSVLVMSGWDLTLGDLELF